MEKDITKKTATKISIVGAFIAGLCCFSPLILFLIGGATASFAGSLADTLYYEYKWYFRLAGFLFLAIAYIVWYKKRTKGCTLDKKKKIQKKFLNLFLLSIIIFILAYIVWLYIIVEYWGIQLNLWELPDNLGKTLKELL